MLELRMSRIYDLSSAKDLDEFGLAKSKLILVTEKVYKRSRNQKRTESKPI